MNKTRPFDAKDHVTTRTLLPIIALGGTLVAGPAAALELGDLTVHSNLGQPLRASVAYALAPSEALSDTCVSISTGRSTNGLPAIGTNTIRVTESAIVITSKSAIREPMLGLHVTINCPNTPNLSREYMLFIDPAKVAEDRAVVAPVTRAEPAAEARPTSPPVSQPPAPRRIPLEETPVGQATRYRVQPGDTLSDIVRRIENRDMGLWPAVNRIFHANPEAFVDNDPDKLKAGSWLTIPSLDGTAPVVEPVEVAQTLEPAADAVTEQVASETLSKDAMTDTATGAAISVYDPISTEEVIEAPVEEPVVADSTTDLLPGDVILENTATDTGEVIIIPDTELEAPPITSTSPTVPATIVSTGTRSDSTSLLAWLIAGGLAVIGAAALFRRRLMRGFGSKRDEPAVEQPSPRPPAPAMEDTAYDIDDDSPTGKDFALDEDLGGDPGLEDSADVDINQDFNFVSTTKLDYEFPFETEDRAGDSTDIIPPLGESMESILDSEVLPENDDYDMSVIMDATKMPQPEDVTERDLMAVEVGSDDDSSIIENYAISKEVDYDILEQDYEDELFATQALNKEIERAAAKLASDLGEDATNMLLASVGEIDATSELPAQDSEKTADFEAAYDPDDTNAMSVKLSPEDRHTEGAVANDDESDQMDISGGTIDTKKLG